jgi:hypothetical protein
MCVVCAIIMYRNHMLAVASVLDYQQQKYFAHELPEFIDQRFWRALNPLKQLHNIKYIIIMYIN